MFLSLKGFKASRVSIYREVTIKDKRTYAQRYRLFIRFLSFLIPL
jgi:hypothetical protein